MKQPKKKIKVPDMSAKANTTGVSLGKPILKDKVVDLSSIKDGDTREYLKERQTYFGDNMKYHSKEEERLVAGLHIKNGNPTIRPNKTKSPAHYNHFTNEMYINPRGNNGDYEAELAHAQQTKKYGKVGMTVGLAKDWVKAPYLNDKQRQKQYTTKGTKEQEAHDIIEPKLKEQSHVIYNQVLENDRALKAARPKIKKANKGIQEVNPEMSKGVSAGIAGATAVAGIAGDALTERAVKNKWGKTNKAQATAGSALSMGAQGAQLGAAAGPWGAAIGAGIGLVGGGIMGAVKADKANTEAEYARLGEKNTKFNDSLTSSTINQKSQFKNGGKVKIKKSEVATDTTNVVPAKLVKKPSSGELKVIRGREKRTKAVVENGLNAASYLRAIPTPLTQGIGWGAAAASSAMDLGDAYQMSKKGDTTGAKFETIGAVANLTPLKNVKLGSIGGEAIRSSKGATAKVLASNAGNLGNITNAAYDAIDAKSLFKNGGTVKTKSTTNPHLKAAYNKTVNKNFKPAPSTTDKPLQKIGNTVAKGVVKGMRATLPINAAMYAQDLGGNIIREHTGNKLIDNQKIPLTEKDLTPSELQMMKKVVSGRKNKDFIDYEDYPNRRANKIIPSIIKDDQRMMTTIGQAQVKETPNDYKIKDTFDFNDGGLKILTRAAKKEDRLKFTAGNLTSGNTYLALRNLGGIYGSKDGEGAPVDIKIPKKQLGGTNKATKVIEIEGKKTPEIHTDSNFNVKNLGTTPHSKGGDKVLAQEGDVVFPTQNSPAKYNKVMNAIKTGDKQTLKKEQAKLPKDGSKKYAGGVDNIETETPEEKAARLKQEAARSKKSLNKERQNPIGNIGQAFVDGWNKTVAEPWERNQQKNYRLAYKLEYGDEQYKKKYGYSFEEDPIVLAAGDTKKQSTPTTASSSTPTTGTPTNFVNIGKSLVASNGGAAPLPVNKPVTPAEKSKSGTVAKGKNTSKGGKPTAVKATLTPPKLTGSNEGADLTELKEDPFTMQAMEKAAQESRIELGKSLLGKGSLASKVAMSSVPTPSEFLEGNTDGKGRIKIGVDNFDKAMELAPIAYNLGKGLFGKVEKVERNYINPEMETYNDLSANSRSKSNQAYQAQKSNARNASGGNMANFRSNAQSAANEEVSRQADINTQEISRQTDVNSRNTQLKNNSKQINLELKNQYNELDSANKAAKEGLIQAGLGQLGQLGTRNIIQKNERAAQKIELDSIAQNSNFGFRYNDKGELIGGTDFKTGRELTALEATLQLQKHQQKPAQRTRGGNN